MKKQPGVDCLFVYVTCCVVQICGALQADAQEDRYCNETKLHLEPLLTPFFNSFQILYDSRGCAPNSSQ